MQHHCKCFTTNGLPQNHNKAQQLHCHHKQIHKKYTCMFTKDIFFNFLTYGIALNSFAVGDDGCFHIRDDILVECHIINKCVIPCKNVLQKLLSMIGIMCQMHVKKSNMMGHVIIWKFLWHPVCTLFSVIHLVMGDVVCTTQKSIRLWGTPDQLNMSVLSANGTHNPSGHASVSWLLLVVSMCPAIN